MAKKPETLFVEKMKEDLEKLKAKRALLWYQKIQQVGIRGTPDILLCAGGFFIALEVKKDEAQKADPLQVYNLQKIKEAGGQAFLVTPETWSGALQTIKKLSGCF